MNGGSWFGNRVDVSWSTALLAVGDLVALTAFVAVGQYNHWGTNPFATPVRLLGGLVPFLVGWGIVALIGGLYTHDALLGLRRMLSWAIPAWVLGVIVALLLRSTEYFPGNVSGLFPVVATVFGGLLVVGWRGVAATILSRPETPTS